MKSPNTKPTTLPCFECDDGVLRRELIDYETKIPEVGQVVVPNVPIMNCDQCDCQVMGDEAGEMIDAYLDKVTAAISPEEIQALLDKYSINQKEAAEITGYGEKTFSRWLRGHMRPSRSVSINLRTLLASPEAFEIARKRNWDLSWSQNVA